MDWDMCFGDNPFAKTMLTIHYGGFRMKLISMLFGLFMLANSSAATAQTCEEYAQRAYDSAFRECQSGDQCRTDRDCPFGYECDRGRCVLEDQPVTCIPNCTVRWSDGSCRQYGADFCGRNPSCVTNCSVRWSDGTCRDYGPDFCGEGRVTCTPVCTSRWSDGSCRTWGADICG